MDINSEAGLRVIIEILLNFNYNYRKSIFTYKFKEEFYM